MATLLLTFLLVGLVISTRVREGAGGVQEGFDVNATSMTEDGRAVLCSIASAQVDEVCDGDANVARRLFFGDKTKSKSGNADNNTDSYYMEKIVDGSDKSHLRLTINDNADESFQIWGGSCKAGDCSGPGALAHLFQADGNSIHTGNVDVYGGVRVGDSRDMKFGIGLYKNYGQDGNEFDVHNGGIDSWNGIGFRNRIDNVSRFVHDTRTGKTSIRGTPKGSRWGQHHGTLCLDDVCIESADLLRLKMLLPPKPLDATTTTTTTSASASESQNNMTESQIQAQTYKTIFSAQKESANKVALEQGFQLLNITNAQYLTTEPGKVLLDTSQASPGASEVLNRLGEPGSTFFIRDLKDVDGNALPDNLSDQITSEGSTVLTSTVLTSTGYTPGGGSLFWLTFTPFITFPEHMNVNFVKVVRA